MRLPPKRWESTLDSKYDSIRFKPWFWKLEKRKKIIPLMEAAFDIYQKAEGFKTQKDMTVEFGLSEREFQDFIQFRSGYSRLNELDDKTKKTYRSILDSAYLAYREHYGIRPIRSFISDFAPLYGVNERVVYELWQVDPTFYPTGYEK